MQAADYLGKVIVARNTQGDLVGVGRCVAMCDAPTVTLRTSGGEQISWRADLCEITALTEDVVNALFPMPTVSQPLD